ncbi:50S ribosomal protein L18 [bacterium]|nr:50S ribosomal protein L18 [bacterium]
MNDRETRRLRRHRRIRKKVAGTPERPRLCVRRSLVHIYAQLVDDLGSRTVVSASTLSPELRQACGSANKTAAASLVGQEVARRAIAAGIQQVTFDRGGCRYHGRVQALAEAARKGGLTF